MKVNYFKLCEFIVLFNCEMEDRNFLFIFWFKRYFNCCSVFVFLFIIVFKIKFCLVMNLGVFNYMVCVFILSLDFILVERI